MNRKPMTMSLSRGLRWLLMACALPWASTQAQAFTTGFQVGASMTDPYDNYTADTWTIWGGAYDWRFDSQDYEPLGVPPVDANGNPWYAYDYTLTNDAADVLPNGDPIVWQEREAPFDGNYLPDNNTEGNFYMRRYFTTDETKTPENLRLYVAYDDSPLYVYLNGELIFSIPQVWTSSSQWVDITEYASLIRLNGEKNVIAATCWQADGGYYLDCGLYSNGLYYEVNDEENHTVTVYNNNEVSGNLVIPSTVDYEGVTYTVNRIGGWSFCWQSITSLTVPSSVEVIEGGAFYGCTQLQEVSLPSTLKTLCDQSFAECNELSTLVIPSGVELQGSPVYPWNATNVIADQVVYYGIVGLVSVPTTTTEFELGDGYNTIGYYAFADCDKLTSVTLPISINTIYDYAFQNCTALTDIHYNVVEAPELPENVFDGVDKSKITIHTYSTAVDSFKERWGDEFTFETGATPEMIQLNIIAEPGQLGQQIIDTVNEKHGNLYFFDKLTVTGSMYVDELNTIADYCKGNYQLVDLDLSGVKLIDWDGQEIDYFPGWQLTSTNLQTLALPDNITRIESYALYYNAALISVTIPESVTYIGEYAFQECSALTSVDIPATVTYIGDHAFFGCTSLATVTGCEGLNGEEMDDCWWVFGNCPALTTPIYNETLFIQLPTTYAGEYVIPEGIKSTLKNSCSDCYELTSVVIPASMELMRNDTFGGCWNLTKVTSEALVPPTLQEGIFDYNFNRDNCTVYVHIDVIDAYEAAEEWCEMRIMPIESVTIEINVETAGTLQATLEAACSQISYLSAITVTGNVNGDDMQYLAQLCSNGLANIDLCGAVMEGQTNWQNWFGWHSALETITLPQGITSLDWGSFYDCSRLVEVNLPETLTYIESEAFRECVNLTTLTGLENVCNENQYSSNAIFYGCTKLTEPIYNDKVFFYLPASYAGSYEVPEGIEQICSYSMWDCTGLTEVTLPESVQKMGYSIFNGCESLTTINSYAIEPPTGWGMFYGLDSEKVTVYVPLYALTTYRNASYWNQMNITSFEGIDDPLFTTGKSYTLPSYYRTPSEPYTAQYWAISGPEYDGINMIILATPPADAEGRAWYETDYVLTNSVEDTNYDGTEVVWAEGTSPFCDWTGTQYLPDNHIGDIYLRRSFTIEPGTELPSTIELNYTFDDAPAEFYLNGVLIYSNDTENLSQYNMNLALTAEQIALLKTDGTENVLAAHVSQDGYDYMVDLGLYGNDGLDYEIIGSDEARLLGNTSYAGNLVIPETVTVGGSEYKVVEIAENAFNNDDALTSVVIPATVRKIYSNAFSYCDQLTEVTILGEGLESVGDYAFYDCYQLAELALPKSVTECNGNVVYYWNTDLQCYLTLYDGKTLVSAPLDATEFTITEGTTNISNYAFSGCSSLTTVYIPRSVSSIGSYSFRNCTSLTDITYKAISAPWIDVENVFAGVDKSAVTVHVYECALESFQDRWGTEFNYVTMPDPVPVTLTINVEEPGTLAELILEAVAKLDATVYDVVGITVTGELNENDLYDNYDNDYSLKNLSRSPYALAEMNLEGATVPDNEIRWDGFYNSRMLTDVVLPSNLESLNYYAFQSCTSLQTIVLPETLTYINHWAFDGDYNLRAITCYAVTPPELASSDVFRSVEQSTCILFVPEEAVDTYKATEIWQDFDIHAIGEALVTLTPSEVSIYPYNGYQLEAYSTYEDDTFTWTSSDEEVVTVDEAGYITGVAPGEATITVTSSRGAEATSVVTVLKWDDWIWSYSNLSKMLYIGNSVNLADYIYSNSDEEVYFSVPEAYNGIVELSGTTLTCLAAGEFQLNAWTDGNDWYNPGTREFTYTVVREKPDYINYTWELWDAFYMGAVVDLDQYIWSTSGETVYYEVYYGENLVELDGSIITCIGSGTDFYLKAYTLGSEDYQSCESGFWLWVYDESPKDDQWINWYQDFDDVFAGNIIPLEAWASSGLQVEYEIVEGAQYATMIDATTLGCLLPGTVVVRASQPGNVYYYEATPVEKTIVIKELSGIESIAADTEIELYSVAGYLVFKGRAADREYTAPGIYVLRIGNQTYKVAIK